MTSPDQEPPVLPRALCPTCQTPHDAPIDKGQTMTVRCQCGKLLLIERGPTQTLVVREQAEVVPQPATTIVEPPPPPPPDTSPPPLGPAETVPPPLYPDDDEPTTVTAISNGTAEST